MRRGPEESKPTEASAKPFYVVGVGASAGGLEALGSLIGTAGLDGIAWVVIQHLAPTHDSALPALLERGSKLQVVAAEQGMRVEPDHVYVIQPHNELSIRGGILQVGTPPAGEAPRLPIDFFLRSLAADQGPAAIGVILSGTGTDGTFGLRAIKEAGGITFAQDPASAKFDGMPRSALESGWADFGLAPPDIAQALANLGRQPFLGHAPKVPLLKPDAIQRIVLAIGTAFGHDLGDYKPSTLERRIGKRMALHQISTVEDYVKYLSSNRDELRALYKDLLIGVTSFFRDREVFDALPAAVFERVLERRAADEPIRIWVPACSTGEEAYSIAIALLEVLEEKRLQRRIQIFASDLDGDSVDTARKGLYRQNIEQDVTPERLARFFVKRGIDYQVARRVRDLVVFSTHNLLTDAPFSRLDLVSCRNLLIYLQPHAQREVFRRLHYSLDRGGFLLLGSSETVGDCEDLFSLVDRTHRIYASRHVASVKSLDVARGARSRSAPGAPKPALPARPAATLGSLADQKILEMYAPAGAVVNENLDVLHFRGRTGPYLEPVPGVASLSILKLARPELHLPLRRSIQRAFASGERVRTTVTLVEGRKPRKIGLEVVPMPDQDRTGKCLLVLFHESPPPSKKTARIAKSSPGRQRIEELERDLILAKQYLQSTIEQLQASNEELQSSNEELQSSNEELQSTNEELETSKEELQSSNEELTTVNDELRSRVDELQRTSDDLHNVLSGVGGAVVITGMDQRVRRFTAAAERLFKLVATDVGRPIGYLDPFLGGERLESICTEVAQSLKPVTRTLQAADGRWYELHIAPYRTLDGAVTGTVIVATDVDAKKRSVRLGEAIVDYAHRYLSAVTHPLLILDKAARVVWANDPFYRSFQVIAAETVGSPLRALANGAWADPKLRAKLESTTETGVPFQGIEIQHDSAEGGRKTLSVGGSRLPLVGEESALVLLSVEEVPHG